jgi:RNA polymerase sigma-70 factor (ECF subfamily)
MQTGSDTDEALVRRLRDGDMAAFDALYARYERRLFGYVRRMVADTQHAEDLFQEVFYTVLTDRSYDPAKGRFAAWLFTVARNRCNQDLRKRQRRDAKDRLVAAVAEGQTGDPAEEHARRSPVQVAMGSLDEPQRQLLMLKQVGELTYKEIGTLLGVAEGTIKSRLHEAMKQFRRRLAELTEAEG